MTDEVAEATEHNDPPVRDMSGDEWRQAREAKYQKAMEAVEARIAEGESLAEFLIWAYQFLTDNMSMEDEGYFAETVDRMDIWKDSAQREEFRNSTFWFCYGPGVKKRESVGR